MKAIIPQFIKVAGNQKSLRIDSMIAIHNTLLSITSQCCFVRSRHKILLLLLLFNVSIFLFSCEKETSNVTEEIILTHEDSIALGLIKDDPVPDPDTPSDSSTSSKNEIIALIGDICYILDVDNLTAQVTFKGRLNCIDRYEGNIVIPETVQYENSNFSVTAIDHGAFSSATIKTVTIPSSVTRIGHGAFCNSRVEKVIIKGDKLEVIEENAFDYCPRLSRINLPNSVKEIKWRAFHSCGLDSIILPDGLRVIEKEVFRACLKKVKLPKNLEIIEEGAFSESCIEYITFPATIKSIGKQAFTRYLKQVHCYAVEPPEADYTSFPNYALLYVPRQSISKYRQEYPWLHFHTISAIESY